MIARIIEFSARNTLLIVLFMIAIIGAGFWAVYNTPLDAIPDLSDIQVIVSTDWEDRSPNIIEDQVTYPIVTQLLSAPKVKAVRATRAVWPASCRRASRRSSGPTPPAWVGHWNTR